MVSMRSLVVLLASMTLGCTLINAPSTHTQGRGRDVGIDAAVADAPLPDAPLPPDVGFDAPLPPDVGFDAPDAPLSPPAVRVAHLARGTGLIDITANGISLTARLAFSSVGEPGELAEGPVDFRVTRAGTDQVLIEQSLTVMQGRNYTLTFYGDEVSPPFPGRTIDLLLLDDDATGIGDSIRLAAVHVATPVSAGQLVSVNDLGIFVPLATDFAYRGVATLTLPARPYTVGFDAGADGTVDLVFAVPGLANGTYANVFVAARSNGSVYLLVNTSLGFTGEINPS